MGSSGSSAAPLPFRLPVVGWGQPSRSGAASPPPHMACQRPYQSTGGPLLPPSRLRVARRRPSIPCRG
eukprot:1189949-Prorocentrum_minimum.AAC.7